MGAWKNSNQKPNFAQLHSRTVRVGMSKSSFTARLPCNLADSRRKMRLRIGSNIVPRIGSTRTATTAEMNKLPKRPRDLNQWAKRMVDIAVGEASDREPTPEEQGKSARAVARGKLGGLRGAQVRAA